MERSMTRILGLRIRRVLMVGFLTLGLGVALAQITGGRDGALFGGRGGGRGRGMRGRGNAYYEPPARDIFPSSSFTFCRISFDSEYGRSAGGGRGWRTDYPLADLNFPRRLHEMTTLNINATPTGEIKHVVLSLTDPELFKYPFIFFNAVGAMSLHDDERKALQSYLLRGGFMVADDCWGDEAWQHFVHEMQQVLPPEDYPIVEIPLTHEVFHIVFDISEVPQCPTETLYAYWQRTGVSYDPNVDYPSGDTKAHLFGVFDTRGRLMALFTHNSHLSDGWEQESASVGYFADFSVKKAYPLGINMVVYAMTH
jgi:hypothetical protein